MTDTEKAAMYDRIALLCERAGWTTGPLDQFVRGVLASLISAREAIDDSIDAMDETIETMAAVEAALDDH